MVKLAVCRAAHASMCRAAGDESADMAASSGVVSMVKFSVCRAAVDLAKSNVCRAVERDGAAASSVSDGDRAELTAAASLK